MSDGQASKLVYLAGPIDLVDQGTAQGWRGEAAAKLKEQGWGVFSPAHAFELPDAVTQQLAVTVLGINKAALDLCDAILCNLAGPGYGTPIEMCDFMTRWDGQRPAACFNGNEASLYVKTWPHFESMDAAIAALVDRCP